MKPIFKKISIGILAIILLATSAYYFFIFIIVGYNPFLMGRNTTKKEIIDYSISHRIPYEDIYIIDSASYKERGSGSFPKLYLYNEKGQQLKFHNCFKLINNFLDTLKYSKSYFILDTTSTLEQEIRHFTHIDEKPVDNILTNQRYYLIYYYPLWSKWMNQKKLFPLRDKIAKEDAFKLYMVNCDKREEWHLKSKK